MTAFSRAIQSSQASMRRIAGLSVTWSRTGETDITTKATPAQTRVELGGQSDQIVRSNVRDWIVPASVFAGWATSEPQDGDTITVTEAGKVRTYQARPIGDAPCFGFSDTEGHALRVHCQLMGEVDA